MSKNSVRIIFAASENARVPVSKKDNSGRSVYDPTLQILGFFGTQSGEAPGNSPLWGCRVMPGCSAITVSKKYDLRGQVYHHAAHKIEAASYILPPLRRVCSRAGESERSNRNSAAGARRRWRAGGILLQFLPKAGERARQADLHPGDAPPGSETHTLPEDDAWVEGRSLVATVDDVELIDPALSSERLAYSLFHEHGVRVFRPAPVNAQCSCSRHSVEAMLKSFSQDERDDMVENGKITVTCEFCSSTYVFEPDEISPNNATLDS